MVRLVAGAASPLRQLLEPLVEQLHENLVLVAVLGLGIAVAVWSLRAGYLVLRSMITDDIFTANGRFRESVDGAKLEKVGNDGHTASERRFDREYKAASALEKKHF